MKTNASISRKSSAMRRGAVATFACALLLGCVTPTRLAAGEAQAEQKANDVQPAASAPAADTLQSEFLFELILERGTATSIGSPVTRVIVPVAAGTVSGPKLKATVIAPSGDWIVVRPDGTSVLDLHLLLQTDDGQKIYMVSRGIAYTPAGGAFSARLLPAFETSAPNYAWLNNVVAVGVYRPEAGKIAYRIYQIL